MVILRIIADMHLHKTNSIKNTNQIKLFHISLYYVPHANIVHTLLLSSVWDLTQKRNKQNISKKKNTTKENETKDTIQSINVYDHFYHEKQYNLEIHLWDIYSMQYLTIYKNNANKVNKTKSNKNKSWPKWDDILFFFLYVKNNNYIIHVTCTCQWH